MAMWARPWMGGEWEAAEVWAGAVRGARSRAAARLTRQEMRYCMNMRRCSLPVGVASVNDNPGCWLGLSPLPEHLAKLFKTHWLWLHFQGKLLTANGVAFYQTRSG